MYIANSETHEQLWSKIDNFSRDVIPAFSPDNKLIAYTLKDKRQNIYINNIQNGVQKVLEGALPINFLIFSPNADLLLSATEEQALQLWNIQEGCVVRIFEKITSSIESAAFSPDGTLLACGCRDNSIRVWNIATGTIVHTFPGHKDTIKSVTFSPNSLLLASGSMDTTIGVWNIQNATRITTLHAQNQVFSVIFSDDGGTLISCSKAGSLRAWQMAKQK